ncbi:MAG: exo-alpha-sialidase [Bryobacteraceae bacterium]|nr:exo-alpha-sialidase [Bryobacteraceae bacterium]
MTRRTVLTMAAIAVPALTQNTPGLDGELIFPLETWHNHSSSIVELPGGDLLVCWFHGSGERTADDVKILGARWSKSTRKWSAPFDLADTPGFPDTNPTLFVDSKKRLWLFWPAILANEWETALMKYKMSTDYAGPGAPRWTAADNILLIPKNLVERTTEVFKRELKPTPYGRYAQRMVAMASDKLSARLGWFSRTHCVELPSGRMILPLYSDGFSFSLMAISDDGGQTWFASEPIVGYGNIQPSVVRKKDGTLVAYMRDNGPPPKRIHFSSSKDNGMTWTQAEDSMLPNPGTSVEAISLKDGRWIILYNDLENGRNSLAVSMSDDEGASWKWTRHLDRGEKGRYHYPSVIQAQDGSIHATYSYFVPNSEGKEVKSIKHVHFAPDWVRG